MTVPVQPNVQFRCAPLSELSTSELLEIVQARVAIFVVEQHCPYQEVDDYDAAAHHLQGRSNGQLSAYARIVGPGLKFAEPSIGRVIVLPEFRALQLGRALMQEAIAATERLYPGRAIRLSAQSHLQAFYGSVGFVADSAPYVEDGIPHVDMLRPSPAAAPSKAD